MFVCLVLFTVIAAVTVLKHVTDLEMLVLTVLDNTVLGACLLLLRNIGSDTATQITAAMLLFGKTILSMFLDVSKEGGVEAMEVSWRYLKYMCYSLVILYVIYFFGDRIGSCISDFVNAKSNQIREIAMGEKLPAVSRIFLCFE